MGACSPRVYYLEIYRPCVVSYSYFRKDKSQDRMGKEQLLSFKECLLGSFWGKLGKQMPWRLTLYCIYFQITTMQLEREKALEHKNRMSRMLEDRDLFVMRLKAARQSVYEVRFLCLRESKFVSF